jgi:hypothetical protein
MAHDFGNKRNDKHAQDERIRAVRQPTTADTAALADACKPASSKKSGTRYL